METETNPLGVVTGDPGPIATLVDSTMTLAHVTFQPEVLESTTEPAPVTTQPALATSPLQGGESSISFVDSSSSTSGPLSDTPLKPTTSPNPSHATAFLTSSVATVKTPATVTHSSSPIPPSSGSAGLSGAAKVGIGLGIPLGILLCAAIIYFSIRYHRRRTLRGIRPTELHADTAEKNTKVQNRDDGVVRELY